MGRIGLSICTGLLLILSILSGCKQAVSDYRSDVPSEKPSVASDITLISITCNNQTTHPYIHDSWSSQWTGKGFLAADAMELIYELPDLAAKLPVVIYHDDFAVYYPEGVSYSYMLVYDETFKQLYHVATYDKVDYLSCLGGLPDGTYYVGIAVSAQGKYIKSQNKSEMSGYDCVFKLVVNNK